MKVKTSNLIGPALDWAVAKCRGFEGLDGDEWLVRDGIADMPLSAYTPSTDWAQGGPIIEREKIAGYPDFVDVTTEFGKEMTIENGWKAHITPRHYWMTPRGRASGPTPLIAAMRCFVASKLGDDVEVPNELFKE